ncbi:acylphosphatase [Vreelandella sp. EE7]
MVTKNVRAWVSGKVQGVHYRSSTQQQARTKGVTGYAKNLPDGRVEVLMCGDAEAVTALGEWLWQGPANAHVTEVSFEEVSGVRVPEGFTTA